MTRRRRLATSVVTSIATAQGAFVSIALVAITAFIFLIPAGWGLDEQSHVNRAYQISEGVFAPQLRADGKTYGGDIPQPLQDFEMLGHAWSNVVDRSKPYFERHDFQSQLEFDALARAPLTSESPVISIDFTNAGASSAVVYLPAAAGFVVARLAHLDVGAMTVLARMLNGLAYVLLAFGAIKMLAASRWRWLVFAVALIPQMIFQASYVSADTVSNGVSLLFVAMTINLFVRRDTPSPAFLAFLAAATFGLVLAKPTYVVLAGLLVFVPNHRFGTARLGLSYKLVLGALTAGLTAVVLLLTRDIAGAIREQRGAAAALIDPVGQVLSLVAHPTEIVLVPVRTLAFYGRSWTDGAIALFGYNTVQLPEPFVSMVAATLLVLALAGGRLPMRYALALSGLGLATALAVIFALYATFNPVGARFSDGVQGRYFLPVALPLFVGVVSLLPARLVISARPLAILAVSSTCVTLAVAILVWTATLY